MTVANLALRGEPTGVADAWRGDVAAVAKFDLPAGKELDGEGGYTVWGKLMPAKESLAVGALPIGLAHGFTLKNAIKQGDPVRWTDIDFSEDDFAVKYRRRMESEIQPS